MAESESQDMVRARPARRVIALVGADTFLGRNLLSLLDQDDSVTRTVLVDGNPGSDFGAKARHYSVDRTQPSAPAKLAEIFGAEGVTTVIHLGFLEQPVRAQSWAHELESVGTMHLLNACREQDVRQLVFASSTALYGAHHDNPNFLTEEHPLRGLRDARFFADKIDAERQAREFGTESDDRTVTILRFAGLLGPNVDNYMTRWLSSRWIPTILGFDPLMQVLHEADALAGLKLALDRRVDGVFNLVAPGVLPASTMVRLVGGRRIPLPFTLASRATDLLWWLRVSFAPSQFIGFLRHLCVADGDRAGAELGFEAGYTTREAVTDFAAALRLRQANLLTGAPA